MPNLPQALLGTNVRELDDAARKDIARNPFAGDFPLLAANPELAFLDSAATTQRPACVIEAQAEFYRTMNANPLRGLYQLSCRATEAIDLARAKVAELINAASPNEVVFTRNTTESLNLLAHSLGAHALRAGDEVLISVMEHHSNLIPWQEACRAAGATLRYVYPAQDGTLTAEDVAAAMSERTRIVSVCHVSNVLGVENPIAAIAQVAHAHNAYMVVDAAQSVPHLAVDVQALGVDFLAMSAHKLLGPFGVGMLWGKRELLDALPAFLTGGEMIDAVTEQTATWAPVPTKFEAGTQDAAGIWATGVAVSYLQEVGYDTIAAREAALVARTMERLGELPYVELIGPEDPARHHGVVSFNVAGIHPHDVASLLDTKNVAIRAGHHCAQPLLQWLGIDACNRASLAFYNSEKDVDQLVEGVKFVWEIFNGSN
jgi:cysteine desulfurase/selenocysteine lyase